MEVSTTPRRRTQAQRREETRRALIAAADRAFSRHGFHGASLEAIAEDAGYSKGAVYGRFEGKDDLFLAVVEDRFAQRARTIYAAWPSTGSLGDRLAAIALAQSRLIRADPQWSAAWLEFSAYAARRPDLRRRMKEVDARLVSGMHARMTELLGGSEAEAAYLTTVALTSGSGMSVERLVDPEAVRDEHVERLARAVAREIEWGRGDG